MSTDRVTLEQASVLLLTLVAGGLKPPDVYHKPRTEPRRDEPGSPAGAVVMARLWAAALNEWGVSFHEAERAVGTYLSEPDVGQWPKAWPDPGKVIGRTTIGRAALEAGADPELDRAWAHFTRRMSALLPDGPAGAEDLHRDPLKARALWAGLEAMGGTEGYRMRGAEDPWPVKRWRAAVAAERQRQAREPETRRALVATDEPKRLTVKA